jgi:hypothetical protein
VTRNLLATVAAVALTAGCGYEGRTMPEPADICGTVTTAEGKPVKNVKLVLRPKVSGHPVETTLGPDGAFSVKAVPGEYMFLFEAASEGKVGRATVKSALAAVPAAYQDVTVDHTVTLNPGGGNEIKLK